MESDLPEQDPRCIGVCGLGLLGLALAERLIAAGFAVVGWDVAPERRRLAESLGIVINESFPDCVTLIVCLPDGPAALQAVVDDGLIDDLARGTIVIDCTTCAPSETRLLAGELAHRGIDFLDAPVSGNSAQVRRGEAMLLIGGDPDVVKRCEPVLSALSEKRRHLGPVGAGSTAKLVSNLVLGLNRLVLAEGMALGERAGLDPALLLETLRDSPAYSVAMDVKGERMVHHRYTDPEARLRQHEKDVRLILSLAEELGIGLPLSRVHLQLLEAAAAMGYADADNSAVLEPLRQPHSNT